VLPVEEAAAEFMAEGHQAVHPFVLRDEEGVVGACGDV
jgi:hypothetical protein